jgi:hypothetical protein
MSEIKVRELSEEELAKLVQEVLQNPQNYPTEAKLLLRLSVWRRQGEAYIDDAYYDIVFGDAESIIVKEWDAGYPYAKGKDVVLIPKSVPTIVVYEKVWDFETDRGRSITVYIFTGNNWVSVPIQ